ncbi:MAG: hypothetical protein RL754_1434 [Bacteroidota bacterium]|jgi:hypothetical protein
MNGHFTRATAQYVIIYMMLTAPMNFLFHELDGTPLTLWWAYIPVATIKIYISYHYLNALGLWHRFGTKALGFAVTMRIIFQAPWMMLLIGSVLFIRGQRKKFN